VQKTNFPLEKDLQTLIENNLITVFNCRFIASEFSTGAIHAGRIDTLALSEDNNPVIIEYKKVESSELITQSLFYLHWIQDHKGDFEIAAQKVLGNNIEIDWSDIRVICIAPNYKKYDLHAVQVMGANIELWRYQLFSNQSLYLEEVFHNTTSNTPVTLNQTAKNPVMVAAGKKAAITRNIGQYTIESHLQNKSKEVIELMEALQDMIMGFDDSIEEIPKKYYIAYKSTQNILTVEVRLRNLKIYLKLKPEDIPVNTPNYRDVSNIGHHGIGDVEFTITNLNELIDTKPFIELAYNKIGG
jgi:predicted transport protein